MNKINFSHRLAVTADTEHLTIDGFTDTLALMLERLNGLTQIMSLQFSGALGQAATDINSGLASAAAEEVNDMRVLLAEFQRQQRELKNNA
jgi:hypothetical protein